MKKLLLKLLSRFKGSVSWHIKPEHEVKLAFIDQGIEYYHFTSGFNTYFERYFAAMDYLSMMEVGIHPEFMDFYKKTMREYLNKGDLVNAARLLTDLDDRGKWAMNTEMLYHLAAVFYFDKFENCYTFNADYAAEKIKKWKKNKDILAFFLKSPMNQYLPPLGISDPDIQTYTTAQKLQDLSIIKRHLNNLSTGSNNSDLISTLKSQVQELEELVSMDLKS